MLFSKVMILTNNDFAKKWNHINPGWNGSELDKIVKFTTASETWAQIGSLNKARGSHGVIQTDESFLIVGGTAWGLGHGAYPTEKCDFDQADKMTCVTMEPTLTGYVQYPELLLVEADYCTWLAFQ